MASAVKLPPIVALMLPPVWIWPPALFTARLTDAPGPVAKLPSIFNVTFPPVPMMPGAEFTTSRSSSRSGPVPVNEPPEKETLPPLFSVRPAPIVTTPEILLTVIAPPAATVMLLPLPWLAVLGPAWMLVRRLSTMVPPLREIFPPVVRPLPSVRRRRVPFA